MHEKEGRRVVLTLTGIMNAEQWKMLATQWRDQPKPVAKPVSKPSAMKTIFNAVMMLIGIAFIIDIVGGGEGEDVW